MMAWIRASYCDSSSCVEVSFAKSSYSGSQGGNCIEVGFWTKGSSCESNSCVEVGFHKSTYSNPSGNCIEVGDCDCGNRVLMRDSKDQSGPILSFSPEAWASFIDGVKADEFPA